MPRKRELTWQGSAGGRPGRWKKVYKGRTIYCGTASAKGDQEAYQKALEVWQEEKKRIDAEIAAQPKTNQPEYEEAIRDWEKVLQWSQAHSNPAYAALAREKLADLYSRLEQATLPSLAHGDRFWDTFTWPTDSIESITALLPQFTTDPPPDPASRTTTGDSASARIEVCAVDITKPPLAVLKDLKELLGSLLPEERSAFV